MSEILEISRKAPENKSMDFEFLRTEGIKYIQEIAGKIWTDYNAHDPGITILEALCYAITDLGHRASFPIEDIIAANQPEYSDEDTIKNFYTAQQILPNKAFTTDDYRKLLMDIEIEVTPPGASESEKVGVKNAWISKAVNPGHKFYLHKSKNTLSYEPDPEYIAPAGSADTEQKPMYAGWLYDILLEFSKSSTYGDLNRNTIEGYLVINENPSDTNLEGLTIEVDITLARWDNQDIDWDDIESIKASITNDDLKIRFTNYPNNYSFNTPEIDENLNITLSGTLAGVGGDEELDNLADIEATLNDYVSGNDGTSLLALYQQKIKLILSILEEVDAKLNANRNLCDDFYKKSALKVEEIAVCADVQVEPDVDIEEFQAKMYYEIARFLSPTVFFYSLKEVQDKCKKSTYYTISSIDKKNKIFTINQDVTETLSADDSISVINSTSNSGTYTVKKVSLNTLNSKYTDITVKEEIYSDVITEGEQLVITTTDKDACLTMDQIFEGPLLKHGFVMQDELDAAKRMEAIHVSDLIQIIMDIPGIIAVKNIEIAAFPDEPDSETILNSVKWCLGLSYKDNYVPRLSVDKSTVVFFKDEVPFKADKKEVEEQMAVFESGERTQKLQSPVIYPKVPKGSYRDIEDYTSIQEDFPLTYGVGYEGIPGLSGLSDEEKEKRKAQVNQLKAYLLIFDQLLANWLSQLAHVKELFSMNAERDENGKYKIGHTYYTQPLYNTVSNAENLYINKEGHKWELEQIAESDTLFNTRRNKFLDHLLGRFAEQLTDYALMVQRLSGMKAPAELIDDKLNLLNQYPQISSNRGLAFNYKHPRMLWHIDNKSGLEKRSSLLMGIAPIAPDKLKFSPDFKVTQNGDDYKFTIESEGNVLLKNAESIASKDKAYETLELVVINGILTSNYSIKTDDGANYYYELECDGEILGVSDKQDYADEVLAMADIDTLTKLLSDEFFNNHESNRNNLTPPIENYFSITIPEDTDDDGNYNIEVGLYTEPFEFTEEYKILTGSIRINESEIDSKDELIPKAKQQIWDIITNGIIRENYLFDSTSDYVFNIADRNASILATSVDSNFNNAFVDKLNSQNNLLVRVQGSTTNDGYYHATNSVASGPNVTVNVDAGVPVPGTKTDGNLSFTESYEATLDHSARLITIATDITSIIDESAILSLVGNNLELEYYTIDSFSYEDGKTNIYVKETLPIDASMNNLILYNTIPYSLDEANKTFTVDGVVTGEYLPGDLITLWSGNAKLADYTIKSLSYYGSRTNIVVKESLVNDPRDRISFTKIYQQVSIKTPASALATDDTNAFVVKGGEDDKAINAVIRFLSEKFIYKEGMHLIEHILLRSKNNEEIGFLKEGLTINGNLVFNKTLPVNNADETASTISVEGDITSELYFDTGDGTTIEVNGQKIIVADTNVSYESSANETVFTIEGDYPEGVAGSPDVINLIYKKHTPIVNIEETTQKIFTTDTDALSLNSGETVQVTGSEDLVNDRDYTVKNTETDGITVNTFLLQDMLLPVYLTDEAVTYQVENPYTCIANVILPYWPERFDNRDFRLFFEKTLRLEAPAHVLLKICWISPQHMEEYEEKFKKWLIANNNLESTKQEISDRLRGLIVTLDKMRNIYPVGTLYDPKEHETLKNTIILDNTMLGSS